MRCLIMILIHYGRLYTASTSVPELSNSFKLKAYAGILAKISEGQFVGLKEQSPFSWFYIELIFIDCLFRLNLMNPLRLLPSLLSQSLQKDVFCWDSVSQSKYESRGIDTRLGYVICSGFFSSSLGDQ